MLESQGEVVTRKSKEEQLGNEEDKQALGGVVLYPFYFFGGNMLPPNFIMLPKSEGCPNRIQAFTIR